MKFRMVDRICSWEPRKCVTGVKTVSFEEYHLKSAWGGPAQLPETLLVEALFQLCNWLVVLSSDFQQMALVTEVERVCFDRPVGPGQTVVMETVARRYEDDGILFDGTAVVDGTRALAMQGCLALPADLSEHFDPDDLRVLFSEICRPEEPLRA